MRVLWHPEARTEAHEAARFYAERQPGLDRRFLDLLEDALHRISRRPQLYPKVEGDIHKCRLPRFPYGVIYRTKPETVEILAIMHLNREPGYWKARSG
ncbi:MAG: type II toxin-antitoxin system RelE/ParE family toxin [Nitrospira sp.]|nr:type II toxin-antitoxin system RelE/ParE family toxin [Nitrospira sp.]